MQKTHGLAPHAISKEIQLEEMLKREEEEREDNETKELVKQIDLEKKRQEYIKQAIQERQKIDEGVEQKLDTKNEVNKIKSEAILQIKRKRLLLKQKVLEMRKLRERKNHSLKEELNSLRKVTSQTVSKSGKDGALSKCINGSKSEGRMLSYCKDNFEADFGKFNECNSKNTFCYICCENEFGELNMIKRYNCYNKCHI